MEYIQLCTIYKNYYWNLYNNLLNVAKIDFGILTLAFDSYYYHC